MNVNDLKINTECTLISTKKDKKFEAKSVIRIIERGIIYVDVIRRNGKIVNLSGVSNHLTIDIQMKEPQIFQYITPEIYRRNGNVYYRINLRNKNTTKYNRRRNPRYHIGKTVTARIDNNTDVYPCILKDISAVGFALEFHKKELPKNISEITNIRFIFADMDKARDLKITTDLNGRVRRTIETGDGKILFGCQMAYSYQVDRYVTEKYKHKV